MKKYFVCLVLALYSSSIAADPQAAIESSLPLEGALEAGAMSVVAQYLPGYGLQINTFTLEDGGDVGEVQQNIVNVVSGLASTIKGLDSGDWVSVGMTRSNFMDERTLFLVRIKPGRPETLEVWVNGEKQQ